MKRFTKALSMLLAIVMVVGLLPLSIIADDIQTTHTVQFKLNYNGAHKIPSQKVADGECAVQPEDVTRTGWIFEYWYVKTGDGIQKFDLSQPITEDVTLYARWDEDITYWGPIWSRNILNGIAESEKEDVEEDDNDTTPDEDGKYTVIFEPNGDSVENLPDSQTILPGENVIWPQNPTRNNFFFIGWYTNPMEEDWNNYYKFDVGVTENITLYAKWVDKSLDTDTDGLPDEIEEFFGVNPSLSDTDGDGLFDGIEGNILGCNALISDTDGDGIGDGEEDPDLDGLTNIEEVEIGTNPLFNDSDDDGLLDKQELEIYSTNPIDYDTDDDGFSDGWEITNYTDPLTANERVSIIRTFTAGESEAEVSINVSGEQNETFTMGTSNDKIFMGDIPGKLSEALSLTITGTFPTEGATLRFKVSNAYPDNSTEDFLPVIYYFNPDTQLLEEVPTNYNDSVAEAHLEHFSTYILLNKIEFDKVWEEEIKAPIVDSTGQLTFIDVVFAIDVSGSMSSYNRLSTAKTALQTFIDALNENDRAALIKFSSSASVLSPLTKDKDIISGYISSLNANGQTSMYQGFGDAIELLTNGTESYGYKMIIILSDGKDEPSTTYAGYYAALVENAKQNNIVVYTVGAGTNVDTTILSKIAAETGGAYYAATVTSGITDAFVDIQGETVDLGTDSNVDGISDYHTRLLCEGKLVDGTGHRYFTNVDFSETQKKYPDVTDINELIYLTIQENSDFDKDGLLNGEEIKIRTSGTKVYVDMISDPTMKNSDSDSFNDFVEVSLDGHPLFTDIYTSDLDWLVNDDIYVSALSAERYIDDWWYKTQLGLGNFIYGGEYDWMYAAQKQLLDIISDYADNYAGAYESLYKKDTLLTHIAGVGDSLIKWLSTIDKTLKPAEEAELLDEITYDAIRLGIIQNEINALDPLTETDKLYSATTALVNTQDNILKNAEKLKKLSNDGYTEFGKVAKTMQNIKLKVPSWVSKGANYAGKIGGALEYITAGISTITALGDTIDGYAAITASDRTFGIMYNVLKEISDKSEIDFVKKAANELRISTENQYLEYVSEFKIMLQDFGYSFDEIAIDAMLIKVGPVGWAVMIGRGLSNLISGIGATSREHIYMISAGEAGRYAAMALNRSVEDKGYYLSQIGINTMDYYLLCGLMRISGEIKVIDSCNAKSGLFRWFDDSDEVVSFCESNISRIENLFVKHGLDK